MDNLNSKQIFLPPTWCSSICRNAMNEVCIEQCAVDRDCSGFEEKPNLELIVMPRFPNTDDMSREEKFTSVAIYLSKVVDHLQGVEDEHKSFVIGRPYIDRCRSSALPENVKVKDLLSGVAKANSPLKIGEKCED